MGCAELGRDDEYVWDNSVGNEVTVDGEGCYYCRAMLVLGSGRRL